MTMTIELNSGELLQQAKMTAHDYMRAAVSDINEIFGKGTAAKHPELVAAYITTAALDFGAAIIAQQIRAGLDNIADSLLHRRTDHPLMGETFSGITAALGEVADAINSKS